MGFRRGVLFVVLAVAIGGGTTPGAIAQPTNNLILAEASTLLTQRPGREGGFLKDLNLTPNQIQRIRGIRSQYQEPINQRRRALQQAQQELGRLMAGTAGKGEVQAKFRQVETLRQQLAELQFNSTLDIREVLTPEQRRKFAESMQNRRKQLKLRWQQPRSPLTNG